MVSCSVLSFQFLHFPLPYFVGSLVASTDMQQIMIIVTAMYVVFLFMNPPMLWFQLCRDPPQQVWKFNPSNGVFYWMGGCTAVASNGGDVVPNFGTKGAPSSSNFPGWRLLFSLCLAVSDVVFHCCFVWNFRGETFPLHADWQPRQALVPTLCCALCFHYALYMWNRILGGNVYDTTGASKLI